MAFEDSALVLLRPTSHHIGAHALRNLGLGRVKVLAEGLVLQLETLIRGLAFLLVKSSVSCRCGLKLLLLLEDVPYWHRLLGDRVVLQLRVGLIQSAVPFG